MPSDTAFLNDMPAGKAMAESYDSLGDSADALSRSPRMSVGSGFVLSPRGLSSMIENLRSLGIEIDENNRVLRGLRAGIITGYSLHMLYGAWAALRKAQAAKETAYAAVETTAMAVAQQWSLIAQAGIAATMVYSAFKVGEKLGSGDWNLPSFDMSDPAARRNAGRQIAYRRG